MPVSETTFRQLALGDADGHWELHCGALRPKSGMSFEHNHVTDEVYFQLRQQLDRREFVVGMDMRHVRRSAQSYYILDVHVVPAELVRAGRRNQADRLEVYEASLPLVVEVWSPSTGSHDVEAKLPAYQPRGDLEIWRVHPIEHSLTAWRRQPDGSYAETRYTTGVVRPVALLGVAIDLDALFA